jgi:nucleoid-associated protein EbfC
LGYFALYGASQSTLKIIKKASQAVTNFAQMMQKAHKFKQQMQDLQVRVQATDIAGETAGGLVTCVMTGKYELKSIRLDPAIVKADEKDVLEDLIVAAVNDARAKAEKLMADETTKLMKDMGLPPGLDLPF